MSNAVKSNLRRRLTLSLFSIVILIAVLAIFAEPIVRYFAIRYMDGIGVTANIERMQINLLDGQLSVDGLTTTDEQKRRLAVKNLNVDWQWAGIFDNRFAINSISVNGLEIDIESDLAALKSIGPIEMSRLLAKESVDSAVTEKPENEKSSGWQLQLGPVALNNFDICYLDVKSAIDQCVKWQSLMLNTKLVVAAQKAPQVSGGIVLETLQVQDYLSLDKLNLAGFNFVDNQLTWSNLTLDTISHPSTKTGANADIAQLQLLDATIQLESLTGSLKALSLSEVDGAFEQYAGSAEKLNLNGITLLAEQKLSLSDLVIAGLFVKRDSKTLASVAQVSTNTIELEAKTQIGSVNDLQILATKVYQMDESNQLQAQLAKVDAKSLEFNGQSQHVTLDQLKLEDLSAYAQSARGQNDKLLSLGTLNLNKAQSTAGIHKASGLEVAQVGLMQDFNATDEQMLVSLIQVNLDQFSMADKIELGVLAIAGLNAKLEQKPEAGLNLATWFAGKQEQEPNQGEAETDTKAIEIYLQAMKLNESSKLTFIDHSLSQPITHQLDDISLNVKEFALAPGAKPFAIELSSKIQNSGLLQAKGQVNPNGESLFADVKGVLQHLDLPPYSPYSARNIGHRIDQGQFNVDFKFALKDNKIDSNFDLLLSKFEIDKLQQHEKSSLNNELGVPLSTALNLLRDGDDNIELSLPVKGDLNNPDFSVSGVVSTVTFKALKTAVLYTYSPLGLLTVAGGIVDLATALKFKPVEFVPGDLTLSDDAKARMDKAGQVLKEKSKVSLILCANATKADLSPETPFNDELIPTLVDNANARQQAVQNYLVETHGIEAHRLLMCNVKLDKKADAKPKVGIKL